MAEIIKWKSNQVFPIIKHNVRRLEDGYKTGNKAIHTDETKYNYSLLGNSRGTTCKEINNYRKEIGKKIHRYNRKGLVEAVEIVIQRPKDLKDEQARDFYQSCHDFVCKKFLGGHAEFIFVSEVHTDEHHIPNNQPPASNVSSLSHEHLHIMLVPAVPTDKFKDAGYQFKLSAHELTSKKMLHTFHPQLQEYLDSMKIEATVFHKKKNDGKAIGFTVKQLKELTETYGITLNRSVTLNEFAEIVSNNISLTQQNSLLESKLIDNEIHLQKLKNLLSERINALEHDKQRLQEALVKAEEKILEQELEKNTLPNDRVWGDTRTWGNTDPWSETKTFSEEKLW